MKDAHDYYNGRSEITDFTVTEDHLMLLRRAYVGWDWCEFGAPGIDSKRPYGNSDVLRDIAEILGVLNTDPENDELPPELKDRFTRLHAETAIALQIALATGEFRTGRYIRDQYHNNWRPAPEGGWLS